MDDIMLVNSSVDESDRYGDALMDEAAYYEREQAAAKAAQLSLTQRLAFPELVEADPESGHIRSKPYGRQNELPREESSLNFFAKIITFLVSWAIFYSNDVPVKIRHNNVNLTFLYIPYIYIYYYYISYISHILEPDTFLRSG